MTDPRIAILTDFGHQDPFVGIMKGVIAQICPQARIIDITHGVQPGNIRQAAVMLWQTLPFLPAGTVLLVVVDPGVGTPRRGVAVDLNGHIYIGPDNGLTSFIAGVRTKQWELQNQEYFLTAPSRTFHGRDIFAPAAAHLACGVPPQRLGPALKSLEKLAEPHLGWTTEGRLEGVALHADRFGNVLTSLGQFNRHDDRLTFHPWRPGPFTQTFRAQGARVELPSGDQIALVETFGSLKKGEVGAAIGSSGLLEIVANQDRAVDLLAIQPDTRIALVVGEISQGAN